MVLWTQGELVTRKGSVLGKNTAGEDVANSLKKDLSNVFVWKRHQEVRDGVRILDLLQGVVNDLINNEKFHF